MKLCLMQNLKGCIYENEDDTTTIVEVNKLHNYKIIEDEKLTEVRTDEF